MEEKISVIVPVYNVEPYLERCLDSILQNTYRNLEIICVNDGSPDNCGAILDRYAKLDDRFVVIHKENGGVSSARNRGLDTATGEFIAFVDADDWIHPQYFETVIHCQKKKYFDAVICGIRRMNQMEAYIAFDVDSVNTHELNLEGIFRNHAAKSYAGGKVFRKELLDKERLQEDISFGEDAVFNAAVFCGKEDIAVCYVDIPLYFYYQRAGSLGGQHTRNDLWLLAQTYADNATKAGSDRTRKIYWTEAIKRGLGARYGFSLVSEEVENRKHSSWLVHKAAGQLRRLPNVSLKEKALYSVFAYLPFVYRMFRIIDDPTLIAMEKELRRRSHE